MPAYSLDTLALRAALCCAPEDFARRRAIASVFVEIDEAGTTYVATDGRLICGLRSTIPNVLPESGKDGVNIPAAFATDLCKVGARTGNLVELHVDGAGVDRRLSSCGMSALDAGQYFNWRQVFPKPAWTVGVGDAIPAIASVVTDKASRFWRTLDKGSNVLFVPVNGGKGFFALHGIDRYSGKRSKLANHYRATVYCMPTIGATELHEASRATSYFPE